ncbi:ATP-binding protein, partial [Mesorhizobium sp. M1A.F.Ca.IN.022.05.2.1]|uniref:ATP-binding protein n=1 Tax=Mesorhizobium sp. M1A.F.Ca.IN.022.05.2.1 TaxID=2496760 RepID=UPI001FE22855
MATRYVAVGCSQTKLEAADISAPVAISKGDGQAYRSTRATSGTLQPATPSSASALFSLPHVNALAPGERLSFGKTGLTAIYGDNGAGKSGYARVLKHSAGRARRRATRSFPTSM